MKAKASVEDSNIMERYYEFIEGVQDIEAVSLVSWKVFSILEGYHECWCIRRICSCVWEGH